MYAWAATPHPASLRKAKDRERQNPVSARVALYIAVILLLLLALAVIVIAALVRRPRREWQIAVMGQTQEVRGTGLADLRLQTVKPRRVSLDEMWATESVPQTAYVGVPRLPDKSALVAAIAPPERNPLRDMVPLLVDEQPVAQGLYVEQPAAQYFDEPQGQGGAQYVEEQPDPYQGQYVEQPEVQYAADMGEEQADDSYVAEYVDPSLGQSDDLFVARYEDPETAQTDGAYVEPPPAPPPPSDDLESSLEWLQEAYSPPGEPRFSLPPVSFHPTPLPAGDNGPEEALEEAFGEASDPAPSVSPDTDGTRVAGIGSAAQAWGRGALAAVRGRFQGEKAADEDVQEQVLELDVEPIVDDEPIMEVEPAVDVEPIIEVEPVVHVEPIMDVEAVVHVEPTTDVELVTDVEPVVVPELAPTDEVAEHEEQELDVEPEDDVDVLEDLSVEVAADDESEDHPNRD